MAKKLQTQVAVICLYGNRATGAGWLAAHGGKLLGDGEPSVDRTFTVAVWLAADALRAAGASGAVAVFDAGGDRMSIVPLANVPAYGDLRWEAATQYEISIAAEVVS